MCSRDDNHLAHKGFSLCSRCSEKHGMDKVKRPPEGKYQLASKIQIKSEPEVNKLYLDFSNMDKETLEECLLAYFGERETSISKIISKTIGSYSANGVPRVEELGEERYCLDFSNLRCATRIDWGFLESLVIPEHIFLSALKKFFHYIRDIEGGMWESSVE